MRWSTAFLLLIAIVVAGCDASVTRSPASALPSNDDRASAPGASAPVAERPRSIVFDTDMGMDDLLALYLILRDPSLDVRAIAIDGTGLIRCGAGIRNMRRILGAFDRLDIPFGCGRETPGPHGRSFPDAWRDTSDAMYGVVLPPVAASEFPPDAPTILHDALQASADPVTVLAVGTWTNLQDLFSAHPGDLAKVAGIHSMAGTIDAPGNIELGGTTPADRVEWNVGADPDAFAAVMALDVPVAIVPLDATNDVPVPSDIIDILDADHAAAGADIALETYIRSPYLATEGNYWWDATAAAALTDPDLLTWEDMRVTVTTDGAAAGRINRDPAGRPIRAAMGADGDRVRDAILAGLRTGAPRPEPLAATGTIDVTWDGTACRTAGTMPTAAGLVRFEFHNRSSMPAGVLAAGVRPPKTWADAVAYIRTLDLSAGEPQVPDWVVQLEGGGPSAEAGKDATALIPLPAGQVGLLCAAGEWPKLSFTDAGSLTLSE